MRLLLILILSSFLSFGITGCDLFSDNPVDDGGGNGKNDGETRESVYTLYPGESVIAEGRTVVTFVDAEYNDREEVVRELGKPLATFNIKITYADGTSEIRPLYNDGAAAYNREGNIIFELLDWNYNKGSNPEWEMTIKITTS